MARIKTEKNGTRKDVIVRKAATLFREKGYKAASMRDLAEAVGVEAASLYNHIKSKSELLHELVFNVANRFVLKIDEIESEQISSLKKMEKILRFHIVEMIHQYEEVYVSDREWKHLSDPYLSNYQNQRRVYRKRLAAIIEEASKLLGLFWIYKRGSIHSATDTLVMAGLIGLGFTVFEDFTYSAGSEDAISILIFRAIFSVFAHTFFSGVGAAIMYVLWQKLRGAGIVLGFIFSFLIHYLWNLSQSIDLASINLFLYFIIYAAWPPVVLLITCILVRQKEAAHIISNGARAVGMGVISQNELDQVLNRVARRAALKQRVTRSDKKEYKRELNARARTILEFDSYSLDEFEVFNESVRNQNDPDFWA
jgi:AcrR family transcriptional regulator